MLKHNYNNPFLENSASCRFCGAWKGYEIADKYCKPKHCQVSGCWKLSREYYPKYGAEFGGFYYKCSDKSCKAYSGAVLTINMGNNDIQCLHTLHD